MIDTDEALSTKERLNLETAQIPWAELQRTYARGAVLVVSDTLDLVTVAAAFVDDKADEVAAWLEGNELRKATDDDARNWNDNDLAVWAVAAAPWVLVQERSQQS